MKGVRVIPTQFESEGEILRGNFVLPKNGGPHPGICKFHGLPGSSNQVQGVASKLAGSGFVVLTFDFRGFRMSEGLFRLAKEVMDSHIAVTHLLESELTLDNWAGAYGASFGAVIAVCAAVRDARISTLCLRAPVYDTCVFAKSSTLKKIEEYVLETSVDEMHGFQQQEIRTEIIRWIKEDSENYNPLKDILNMSPRPLLIITGDSDEVVDLDGVKHLFSLAPEPKEFILVENADHVLSDPRTYEVTMNYVVNWFIQHSPMEKI